MQAEVPEAWRQRARLSAADVRKEGVSSTLSLNGRQQPIECVKELRGRQSDSRQMGVQASVVRVAGSRGEAGEERGMSGWWLRRNEERALVVDGEVEGSTALHACSSTASREEVGRRSRAARRRELAEVEVAVDGMRAEQQQQQQRQTSV